MRYHSHGSSATFNTFEAEGELESFICKWDDNYGAISDQWCKHWVNVIPLFDYPDEIHRVIYNITP
ncbi:MAG: transposase [Desulfarculales bacterium]|nr:transposase [Desulfarculales bacterium]